jgi:hypothetical protein
MSAPQTPPAARAGWLPAGGRGPSTYARLTREASCAANMCAELVYVGRPAEATRWATAYFVLDRMALDVAREAYR